VAELQSGGNEVHAARITITGDLPQGSGLSSSAARSTALCLALLGFEPSDRIALAKLCSRVENDWVGAQTGLLDQLAALCSEPGHALRIDFRSLELQPVPLDLGDWTLVTLESGAEHEHAGGGYNERRAECRAAARRSASSRCATPSDFEGLHPRSTAACATSSPRTRAWTR
jgi:galactokinase